MKEKYIDILSLTAGTAVLYYIKASGVSERPESLFMVFGAALFLGFVAGRLLKNFGLPSITSYLLMGVLFGPYCMNVFSASMISDLRFIDEAALSIIAMTAGGEINFRKSRISLSKAFVFVVVQMVVTSAIVFVFLNIFGIYIPSGLFAAGTAIVFMSVIVNAKSPSETVAVIVETGSKGRMTDYILTSVIIKDILVIVVFAVTLSFYGSRDEISVGGVIMKETLSIIFGIAASVVIILYKKYIKSNQGAFILLFTLVLTCITAHAV
jgi:Kef-type K+ transport system membrane component KefB